MIGPITFYLSDFYGFIHVFSVEEIIWSSTNRYISY